MNSTISVTFVFAGLFFVVFIATFIGQWLLKKKKHIVNQDVLVNLNARIKSWWIILISVGGAFLFGKIGIVILFSLSSFAALREFFTIAPTKRGDHYAIWCSFFVFLPLQYYLVYIDWYGLATVLIPVFAFLTLPVVAALRGDARNFLERIADVQWGLMICVFSLSHVPMFLSLDIDHYEGKGILLALFLLIIVQISDVLQYVWGKLYGKRKVVPHISPSKTWEGLIGGVLSASFVGSILFFMTPFSLVMSFFYSLLICVFGFFGGLVMSAIKRDRGIKDWGTSIEGHGGFLDRLDSVVFAAPVFFHVVRYFWT